MKYEIKPHAEMKKPYLLIAGEFYYPSADTGDWIGCYSTAEEAKKQIVSIAEGENKGRKESDHIRCKIGGRSFDWYEIVDLREWAE